MNSFNIIDEISRIENLDRLSDGESDGAETLRREKLYKTRMNPMEELDEHSFKSRYRFSKSNMTRLINIVKDDLEGDARGGHIPPSIQVMAAIRYWARNEIQEDSADMHGLSQPTLSIVSARVATAFASKSRDYIRMPHSTSEQIAVMEGFKRIRGFSHVIGAIDCTHIKIQKQGGESGQFYVNRKGYYSINTQVVCDYKLKITNIVAHWRGSTHDSRIFNECSLKERLERGEFLGRLLGDGGYKCTNFLYTPVLNPTSSGEENYNKAQIATRNTIERTFGIWKSRFRILLTGIRGSLENIKTVIVALAVLHNLAIDFNEVFDNDNLIESTEIVPAPVAQVEPENNINNRRSFILSNYPNI